MKQQYRHLFLGTQLINNNRYVNTSEYLWTIVWRGTGKEKEMATKLIRKTGCGSEMGPTVVV